MTENEQNTPDASQTAAPQVESSATQTESAETDANRETVSKRDFNKVYWKSKQAEREIEDLKQQLTQQNQTQEPVIQQQRQTSDEPTLEQFDYDQDAFTAALVDHRVNQNIQKAFEAREQQEQQQKQQSEHDTVTRAFEDRYARYATENPEYQELSKNGARIFSPHVNQAILHAENGPQVDHYLLSNPEIAERVGNLSPVMAAIEIGKISANLGNTNQTTTISRAPDPIEPVGGGNVSTSDIRYNDNSSMSDYYAAAMTAKKGAR